MRNWGFLLIFISILGAGCATAYGPRGMTGGYAEQRVDDRTYLISFSGNGKTSQDMVWYYWFYRCAEFTRQSGYDYFLLDSHARKEGPDDIDLRGLNPDARWHGDGEFVKTKGSSGSYTPTYTYYGGGGSIVRYTAQAKIRMYKEKELNPRVTPYAVRASKVIELLQPYVFSEGRDPAPPRLDVLKKSTIAPENFF